MLHVAQDRVRNASVNKKYDFTSLGYKATLIFELGKREIMVEIDSGSEEQNR